jgi:hypothetical protein
MKAASTGVRDATSHKTAIFTEKAVLKNISYFCAASEVPKMLNNKYNLCRM